MREAEIMFIRDLAEKLNTTEKAIRSALQKERKEPIGRVPPAIKLGKRVAFRVNDYQTWLENK